MNLLDFGGWGGGVCVPSTVNALLQLYLIKLVLTGRFSCFFVTYEMFILICDITDSKHSRSIAR